MLIRNGLFARYDSTFALIIVHSVPRGKGAMFMVFPELSVLICWPVKRLWNAEGAVPACVRRPPSVMKIPSEAGASYAEFTNVAFLKTRTGLVSFGQH
jgi:hypothetical protein